MKFRPLIEKCADCGESKNIIEDYRNGHNVCGNCGCVFKDKIIDEGGEWRSFGDSNKGDPSRVGSANNPFLETEQLDTMISKGSYSLTKIQMKNYMRGPERTLLNGLNLIKAYCERSSISRTIMDRAQYVYKTAESKKILRGKNHEGSIAACLYIACKLENCPRTFKEISVITSVQKKEIGKCYKIISKEIDSKGIMFTGDIVARFCSDLNLDTKIQVAANIISKNVQENGCLTGRSPDSIAAAIIYLVLYLFPESKESQKDIQNITNVTEVTIKNTYKDLLVYKKEIIPKDLVEEKIVENLPKT